MSATLTEHTISVAGRRIFVVEAGSGPAVVMLHGGGPGASGLSNYSRNIDALAESFRVIVPDMPGYGRSDKYFDHCDPFGFLAGIRFTACSMTWASRQHIWSATPWAVRPLCGSPWMLRGKSASWS